MCRHKLYMWSPAASIGVLVVHPIENLGILLLYNESAKSIYNDFQVIKGDICAKNLAQLTGLGCAAVGF